MKLPPDNLNYPVRLVIGSSSGSGFLIRHENEIYLVTARHVLYQKDSTTQDFRLIDNRMRAICYPRQAEGIATIARIYELDLQRLLRDGDLRRHDTADIVVIKMGSLTSDHGVFTINMSQAVTTAQASEGSLIHYDMVNSRRFADVEVTNDIFVLGYPGSLSTPEMAQINYDSPLARKGIIAGKNDTNRSLILDCPVYGGNSGGLVLEINEVSLNHADVHLIGVVVQFVPFVDQWRNVRFPDLYNSTLQNSGYSVALPVDYIYDLVSEIERA